MPEKTINHYRKGLLTEKEALEMLDKLQVRGAFRDNLTNKHFFIGYDYKNQIWITVD